MPHRHRYQESLLGLGMKRFRWRPFAALIESFREGYGLKHLKADLLSGAILAMIAIPLAMALSIASGVPPQHGLYTVIIGGSIIALLGGSRWQVSGPTAAFVVILLPVVQKFGLSGLLIAGLLAGVLMILMGLARLGQMIQFIPRPVTIGFTSGIAVVIGILQLKDFLGLKISHMPEAFPERFMALFHARSTIAVPELVIGALTLGTLVLWPRVSRKVPAPLIALTGAALGAELVRRFFPEMEIATIGSRFAGGIPSSLPTLGSAKALVSSLDWDMLVSLLPSAFAIAILGAIESLLSATVADGMTQTRHDPDAELIAQGVGNVLCPLFGGIPATGAIARTATNIRYGATSPISALAHALFTFAAVALLSNAISYLPMAALAALLMLVAYNMSEAKHFVHICSVGPRSDVVVLLLCFGLTVIFDMVIGVTVGIVLASLLFMREMASVTTGQLVSEAPVFISEPLPPDVVLYRIAGPLFFGAADNAVDAFTAINKDTRAVIFLLDDVPTLDLTGLVAIESALQKLTRSGRIAYLAGVQPRPRKLLEKSDVIMSHTSIVMTDTANEAIQHARKQLLKAA